MQSFPLFATTSPSNPSHSNDHSMIYYYFIVAVATLILLLLVLNMFTAGRCTCCNLVHSIKICLQSVGFSSNPPKDNGISWLIPSSKYKKGKGTTDDDNECSVCLMAVKNGDEVRKMPKCKHLFHAPCIDMWLYSHSNCPLCRADVFPEMMRAAGEGRRVTSV